MPSIEHFHAAARQRQEGQQAQQNEAAQGHVEGGPMPARRQFIAAVASAWPARSARVKA
jgi:hypothetical protein